MFWFDTVHQPYSNTNSVPEILTSDGFEYRTIEVRAVISYNKYWLMLKSLHYTTSYVALRCKLLVNNILAYKQLLVKKQIVKKCDNIVSLLEIMMLLHN